MKPLLSRRHSEPPTWADYFMARREQARDTALERYFDVGVPTPETPIGDVPMLAMDMETTGLDEQRHAIVSIGVVPFDLQRIRLAERRYWVVRPPRPLNERSITFHHITHSEIEQAPDLDDVLDELLAVMAGRIVVVHYRHIERTFLNAAVKARRGEGIHFPVIDTMSLEARLHRQSWWARLRRWLGRPPASIRLPDSRTRYGLPPYQAHHALIDALATAELLQAQIAHRYSPETPLREVWS
ncbi:3'-5' exonuclease [Chromohalobacter salexigens]|uniref:3'-5' exonuclease n=1 Tax=Chromohalobacter moromii TaxID=2860329 RepID=UPI0015BB69B8|nr:3'-5' exonuclease [Chromohalobacter moromii]MCK2044465.1 3'-5' exonuclease [Chromohalobacter moromii]NWO09310.1 3'-5' exonuclease [Chromohalobacter salexigens]